MTDNPLKKYNQRPGTYITLPSGGRYYDDPPKLTADGELEVRPMTASDELRLKNPDGLMNSDGLFQVIEHVAPGVADASKIPTPDLDAIVLGMRIATYGEMMDIESKCNKCATNAQYQISLTQVLANAKTIDAPDVIDFGELKVKIKPHTAETTTMMSNYQIELVRAVRKIEHNTINEHEEILNKDFKEILERGSNLVFNILAKHIISVITPEDDEIDDAEFIQEWLVDMAAPDYQKIRDAVDLLSKEVINRNMNLKCDKCGHENKVEVSFDPANFFGTSSL